jgi:FdrA protein
MKRVFVIPNRYIDSVTLMGIALRAANLESVAGAECGMGTQQNINMLVGQGYCIPKTTTPNDLMLAIDVTDENMLDTVYQQALGMISGNFAQNKRVYRSVDDLRKGEFDVIQISIPGCYAIKEAKKAIDKGMDVFMFTADVSLEEERDLKLYGKEQGRLVMGPDAGVGLLGGVAMAAGSIVSKGPVGVIGASGSGSQEVACLIEAMGSGVTCILGTGGRDLKKQVGGISMKEDMKRLNRDENTKVICLVSMLADREIMEEVLCLADEMTKPVVVVFLGADEALYRNHRVTGTTNLQAAAKACVWIATGTEPVIGWTEDEVNRLARKTAASLAKNRKYFRGLYTGGTFAEEALMTFCDIAPEITLYTNRDNTKYAVALATHKHSEKHTLLDMGDLDFTAEAPHTVFNPAQRVQRVKQEIADPSVGLIAMDIILGPGVAPDPASCYVTLIQEHPEIAFVFTVCGSKEDPQGKYKIREMLQSAGAIVADSNYESARLCAKIFQQLED